MTQHALGFDIGLSGVRAAVVRDDGLLVASARRTHRRARIGDGVAEHDPADWLEGIEAAGREALAARPVPIACIGVAALGPAPVLVDAELRPLTKALLFALDRRAEPQRLAMVEDGAADTLDNALPKLAWWLEHEPATARRAAWALDATGFAVAALTGVPVMDTITAGDYAVPGAESPVPLPAPVEPTALAGELRPGWAERLGLPPGLPVAAGTYDSFADLSGAGVRRPGDGGLVLGSTTIVCRVVDGEIEPPPGLATSAYPGDGLLVGGWTLSGGRLLDWFEERFGAGPEVVRSAAELDPGGLLALPYLDGERTPLWDPLARGAILGITAATGPPEVYRALVDSLALAVLDHTERLEAALGPCAAWRATGGGTRHPLWAQATADAVGARLEIAPDAGEAVGPALLALRALGIDPERGPSVTIEPDAGRGERLRALLPQFRALSGAVSPILRALA
jgi:xylulokinase